MFSRITYSIMYNSLVFIFRTKKSTNSLINFLWSFCIRFVPEDACDPIMLPLMASIFRWTHCVAPGTSSWNRQRISGDNSCWEKVHPWWPDLTVPTHFLGSCKVRNERRREISHVQGITTYVPTHVSMYEKRSLCCIFQRNKLVCYGGSSHVWETHSAFLVSFRDNLSHGSSSSPPSQIHRESVCVSVLTGIQQADLETPMAGQKQHKSFSLAHTEDTPAIEWTQIRCVSAPKLYFTQDSHHISSQVFLGSVWAPSHMHCVAAPIFHWWYMCDLFPFSSSLAAPWSQMSQDEESFKSCLSILEEVSAAEKASLCEICQREY